ncbi:MAG: MBL fold metallo-hydrolase [Rhizobacter sp.]|nr:MBL fold metallo-hydrolase [Ferruginibacter sp.]
MPSFSQNDFSNIQIKAVHAGGVVKMFSAENGFGGGNVAASTGPDGILLVDNMYEAVTPKLIAALKVFSDSNIRFVINTHFHSDHVQGNSVLSGSSAIIAHENVLKRLKAKNNFKKSSLPQITFSEKMNLHFNGEDILLFHLPNGHTDGDVFVYFTSSKVIHLGDTYFNGMFPAVYKEGGGDILQMIENLEKILRDIPEDVSVIPGHGKLATKKELSAYVEMLKETTSLVTIAIKQGKTLEQLEEKNFLNKYDELGDGGAQTTAQYLAMLFKLLSP